MKRFSVYLALVLLVSLPLKASYFTDDISQESEVAGRQLIGQGIVELLQADGFTPTLAPTDGFLPSVAATKGNCRLYITPIPAQNDLDAAFLFASQGVGGDYAYYYDGGVYTDPPTVGPKFWEYAARHLPKIGLPVARRLRIGVAYSDACPFGGYDLTGFTARP